MNIQSHVEVFNPLSFGTRRIDVIGCGATGSRVALSLARLGLKNIHIWDFDTIEEHNIANQMFNLNQIGMSKTEALAKLIKDATDLDVTIHGRCDGSEPLGTVVFMLTDTMDESRKPIFEKALKYKLSTEYLIETRMGADSLRVYSINPGAYTEVQEYEKTLYSNAEATQSLCGTSITLGPTADIVAGWAVWQLIRWFNLEYGESKEEEIDSEILNSIRPPMLFTRKF